VNRKRTPPKNYFSFVSALPWRWLFLAGLSLAVLLGLTLLIKGTANQSESLEASDIFGVLALIIIPCASLFGGLIALDKFTGVSWLRGIENVGKYTLLGFDWLYVTIQGWRGIKVKKANRRVDIPSSSRHQVSAPKVETPVSIPEPTTPEIKPVNIEPHFKESLLDAESDLGQVQKDEPTFAQADFPEQVSHEAEVPENTDINTAPITPIEETIDSNIIAPEPVDNSVVNETSALAIEPEQESEITTEAEISDEIISYDELKIPNEQQDLNSTSAIIEPLEDIRPESDMSSTTTEDEANILPESSAELDNNLNTEVDDSSEPTKPSSMAEMMAKLSTFVAKIPEQQDASDNVPSQSNETDVPSKPALSMAEIMSSVLSKPENNAEQPSLQDQAKQETARLIAGFSTNFSKPASDLETNAYVLPSITLLDQYQQSIHAYSETELEEISRSVERVLLDYKISVEVVGAYPGPIITRFELSLAPGIKVSRVTGLAKDLARAMLVTSVRVVEIIEGTPFIGLEIPNQERELVSFREILSSAPFQQAKSPITLALGKDVSGGTVIADLAKMPHLLVAGTTGSGKSVAINTMILSMLYKATPDQVRMIMVDPKMLELSIYEGIPHLLTPVVTDMKEAQNALRWAVAEMERRYKLMSKVGVRNLAGFNQKIEEAAARGETIRDPIFQLVEPLEEGQTFPVLSTLPNIVIVIDELADMMMIVGKKVEELIARLAQKARAAGIHLILATQRPSVDVLTGLIKANVPTRISFQVSSRIDSRTILDQGGAEALLGNGDMLYLPSGSGVPIRSHGAFVDDHEVHAVVDYLKSLGGANYLDEIVRDESLDAMPNNEVVEDETDALYGDAVSFVMESGKASISSVQRRFKVGYNRAARMIDQMEAEGIIGEPEGNGTRKVLNQD